MGSKEIRFEFGDNLTEQAHNLFIGRARQAGRRDETRQQFFDAHSSP